MLKKTDIKFLKFMENISSFNRENSFIGLIPKNIQNEEQLFNSLARELKFPEYFGHNWDALWDLFNDFHWINSRQILIIHSDLPLSRDQETLKIYLEILIDAVKAWKSSKLKSVHEFKVIFPSSVQDKIIDSIKD